MIPKDKVLTRLVQIIALCLLVQIGLTHPLWFADRSYPFVPVFDFLPSVFTLNFLFSMLLCLALVLLLMGWQNKWSFGLFLGAAFLALMLDLSKGQVWFYFQSILLGILAFKGSKKEKWILPSLQYLFPFIYFWAGIYKINGFYFEDTFPWFMETFAWTNSLGSPSWIIITSILFELALAIGLWSGKKRKIVLLAGLVFHLTILVFLGPLGQNWNEVVWPWNLTMIALLFLLYWPSEEKPSPSFVSIFQNFKIVGIPFLLIGLMPLFYAINLWPANFSFTLYAGNIQEGILYSPQKQIPSLSEIANQQIRCISSEKNIRDTCYLIIDDWAFSEIKVAPFSSSRQLKQLARKYCACLDSIEDAGLQILQVENWKKEKPLQNFSCKDLLGN